MKWLQEENTRIPIRNNTKINSNMIFSFCKKNSSTLAKQLRFIWRRRHYRRRAAKFRLILGAQGLRVGRDLYRATPVVTRTGPRFFRSHPKDRPIQSPLTTHKWMWRIYSNPDLHRSKQLREISIRKACLKAYKFFSIFNCQCNICLSCEDTKY
jgi:hypothetical protein